jgi:hypothetical protein
LKWGLNLGKDDQHQYSWETHKSKPWSWTTFHLSE